MQEEVNDFVDALCRFVGEELRRMPDPVYCGESVKIVDARNHIFQKTDGAVTDESEDTYAIRDLCHTDEDMQIYPDRQRMQRIARNYWSF